MISQQVIHVRVYYLTTHTHIRKLQVKHHTVQLNKLLYNYIAYVTFSIYNNNVPFFLCSCDTNQPQDTLISIVDYYHPPPQCNCLLVFISIDEHHHTRAVHIQGCLSIEQYIGYHSITTFQL